MNIFIDEELQGASNLLSSTLLSNSLKPASPIPQRRDSILKQQGSMKTEKRVSIQSNLGNSNNNNNNNNNNAIVEYISEKPISTRSEHQRRHSQKGNLA